MDQGVLLHLSGQLLVWSPLVQDLAHSVSFWMLYLGGRQATRRWTLACLPQDSNSSGGPPLGVKHYLLADKDAGPLLGRRL